MTSHTAGPLTGSPAARTAEEPYRCHQGHLLSLTRNS